VEYAKQAIDSAGSTIGVLANNGVILAGEKKTTSKLLDQSRQWEKLFQIDDHICCAVAGITSDANILINKLRLYAAQHTYTYGEPIPLEQIVTLLCDLKQGYTQWGGLRPFGVSFLFAGWDKHYGFQLYNTSPHGTFSGWKAHALGSNSNSADQVFRQDWNEELDLEAGKKLVAKVLTKTVDASNPDGNKLEFGTIDKDEHGRVRFRRVESEEITKIMLEAVPEDQRQP